MAIEKIFMIKRKNKQAAIPFEKRKIDSPYNPEFVAKMLQGDKDLKAGKGKKVTLEELHELFK